MNGFHQRDFGRPTSHMTYQAFVLRPQTYVNRMWPLQDASLSRGTGDSSVLSLEELHVEALLEYKLSIPEGHPQPITLPAYALGVAKTACVVQNRSEAAVCGRRAVYGLPG